MILHMLSLSSYLREMTCIITIIIIIILREVVQYILTFSLFLAYFFSPYSLEAVAMPIDSKLTSLLSCYVSFILSLTLCSFIRMSSRHLTLVHAQQGLEFSFSLLIPVVLSPE